MTHNIPSNGYLVLAQFGDTISTMTPIDAFACTSDEGAETYLANALAMYRRDNPTAQKFTLCRDIKITA